jgi:hypothetical protein
VLRRAVSLPLAGVVLTVLAVATAFAGGSPNPLGDPVPESARVLTVTDPDPAGGPPWGVRTFQTTTGANCDQLGRVVDGRLGTIDDKGSFSEAPLRANGCGGAPPPGRPPSGYGMSVQTTNVAAEGCRLFPDPGSRDKRPRCAPNQVRSVFYGHHGSALKRVTFANADGSGRRDVALTPEGDYVAAVPGTFNDATQPRVRLYFDGGCGPDRKKLLDSWYGARVAGCQVVVPLDEPRPAVESAASRRARKHPSRPSPVRVAPRSGHVHRRFRLRYLVPVTVRPADGYTYTLSGPPGGRGCVGGSTRSGGGVFQNYADMVRGKWDEFLLSPGRKASWCRGVYRVTVSFASGRRTYPPFGRATFVVR